MIQSSLTVYLTDDFKPASVDASRPAELVVGDTNEITVTVPHVQVWTKMFFLTSLSRENL